MDPFNNAIEAAKQAQRKRQEATDSQEMQEKLRAASQKRRAEIEAIDAFESVLESMNLIAPNIEVICMTLRHNPSWVSYPTEGRDYMVVLMRCVYQSRIFNASYFALPKGRPGAGLQGVEIEIAADPRNPSAPTQLPANYPTQLGEALLEERRRLGNV